MDFVPGLACRMPRTDGSPIANAAAAIGLDHSPPGAMCSMWLRPSRDWIDARSAGRKQRSLRRDGHE